MSEIIAEAWRVGVGADDLAALVEDSAIEASIEGRRFLALARIAAGEMALPPSQNHPLDAVIAIRSGVLANDRAAVAEAVDALTILLEECTDEAHLPAIQAWADLALGEVGLLVRDLRVARQRFEAVARGDVPTAIAVVAMQHLIALSVERRDFESARTWCERAIARADDRKVDLATLSRYRLALGYAIGDPDEIAQSVRDLAGLSDPSIADLGRILVTVVDHSPGAGARLEQVLVEVEHDPLLLALVVVVGARAHAAASRTAEAAALVEVGIRQLHRVAPELGDLLEKLLT